MNSLSLLPLKPTSLKSAIAAAVAAFVAEGMEAEEALLKLGADFDAWLAGEGRQFPASLVSFLERAEWATQVRDKPHRLYSSTIIKLAGTYTQDRREAALVLSQLQLILTLADEFQYSSAGIARIISQSERRVSVSWKMIEQILNCFGRKSQLDESSVKEMQAQDEEATKADLGDATVDTIVEKPEFHAEAVGLNKEFLEGIRNLFKPTTGTPFIPYLQILGYVCTIADFGDHPTEYLYTFKPRGNVANAIFGKFPSNLASGGNPMLNNFKAVDRLTLDWSQSREDNREQAFALVRIVEGLSSLSFTPRVQFASAFRRSIIRYIEIKSPCDIRIPEQRDLETIERFIHRVAEKQTGTRGIIEQRLSDFMSAMLHPLPDWRPRGLGDPVNATNRSSRKLGDSDFQRALEQECFAYEAHAGRLTDIYVEEHLRTLRLNLGFRIEEWSHIAELKQWTLKICFVVHQDATSIPKPKVSSAFENSIKVTTFGKLFQEIKPLMEAFPAGAVELFNRLVIAPLDANNTPHFAKAIAMDLISDKT